MSFAELGPNKLGEPLGTYAVGYLDAARVLFTHANEGRGLVDLYFYPAALNLRHGLELLAKQCSDFAAYEFRDESLLYIPGHSLEDAWKRGGTVAKEILASDYSCPERGELTEHFEFLDALVAELHALDPKGMLFRYPEFVSTRRQNGMVERGDQREDTHVPFNTVDLEPWVRRASRAVAAAQSIDWYLGQRSSFLQMHRNDPPARLADLVTGKVSDEHRELWKRISSRGNLPGSQED